MGRELFIEIGTEEIPAEFLPKTLKDMDELIRRELTASRIPFEGVRTFATPRRLVVHVKDVAEKQEEQIIEKLGPAKRVSFDEKGNPTKAALGFAKGQGLDIGELETIVTDKGEYICARKKIAGEEVNSILPLIIPKFILSIPFQKSMRWSNLEIRFARPIHWLVALFGSEVVPFRIENIRSGNESYGHRFMSPASFPVTGFEDYIAKSKERFLVVDQEERKKLIVAEVRKTAAVRVRQGPYRGGPPRGGELSRGISLGGLRELRRELSRAPQGRADDHDDVAPEILPGAGQGGQTHALLHNRQQHGCERPGGRGARQ